MIDLKKAPDAASAAIPFRVRLEPYLIESICELSRVIREKGSTQTDVGGLLYGKLEKGSRIVAALKTFSDAGPRSDLARRERLEKAYVVAVEEANEDPELSSLQLLGWFSFRNGSGLLSSDVVFHNQFFRKPEDLAVVIWRDGATQITTEIYSKSGLVPMTSTEYRWSSVRLSSEIRHMTEPIDLAMRVKLSDDSFLRAYDSDDLDEPEEDWKKRASATFSRFTNFLRMRPKPDSEPARIRALIEDGHLAPKAGWDFSPAGPEVAPDMPAFREDWNRFEFPTSRGAGEARPQRDPESARFGAAAAAGGAMISPVVPEPQRAMDSWPSPGLPPVPVLDLGRIGQNPQRARNAQLQAEVSGLPMVIRPTRKRQFPWAWAAAIFVLCSAAVFAALAFNGLQDGSGRVSQAMKTMFASGDLNLRVRSDEDRLRLTWNSQNPAVSSASEGTLQIVDGATRRTIHLEGRQVMDGSVLYRPLTSDVTFRLEVRGEQGSATGSVRVLDGPQGARSAVLDVSDPAANPLGNSPLQDPALVASAPFQTVPGAERYTGKSAANNLPRGAGGTDAVTVPVSGARSSSGSGARSPASGASNSSGAAVSSNAEPSGASASRSTRSPAISREPFAASRAAQPLNSATARNPALPGTSTINGWDPVPDPPKRAGAPAPVSDFVGPQALVQITPNTSSLGRGTIKSPTRVEVQVRVDQNGHVTSAHVLNSGFKKSVSNAALSAARQWTFQPATLRGQRVESDHTIVFEFRPQP